LDVSHIEMYSSVSG